MLIAVAIAAFLLGLIGGVFLEFEFLNSEESTEINLLRAAEEAARRRETAAQERVDRLMEALAVKSGVDLVLPRSEPQVLEKSEGWWDTTTNSPGRQIAKKEFTK